MSTRVPDYVTFSRAWSSYVPDLTRDLDIPDIDGTHRGWSKAPLPMVSEDGAHERDKRWHTHPSASKDQPYFVGIYRSCDVGFELS